MYYHSIACFKRYESTKVPSKVRRYFRTFVVLNSTRTVRVQLHYINSKKALPKKSVTRDEKNTYKSVRAKHCSSARDARLPAKLCTMTVLRHAHSPMVVFFRISRASRRKRRSCPKSRFAKIAYPTRGREHEREIPHHRKFNLDAWNEMVQIKIVAISFEEGVVFRVEGTAL